MSATSPAHAACEETLYLAPLETRTFDVRVTPRPVCVLTGELRSRTGMHVPSGSVRLRSLSDPDLVLHAPAIPADPAHSRRDTFRFDTFHFDAVPPGEYELLPPMDDAFAWEPASVTLTLPGAAPVLTCRDDVALVDVTLSAVDDATGRPIERFRAAIVLDRNGAGRRRALALEPGPRWTETRNGEAIFERIPRGMEGWWLIECDGRASAWGRLDDLRGWGAARRGEARLERAWTCRMWIGAPGADGRPRGVEGARILTSAGKLLAQSDERGDVLLDLLYDPGRIAIDAPGWRVRSMEGFARGKLCTTLDVNHVWLEPER